jgi:hypothetical protein
MIRYVRVWAPLFELSRAESYYGDGACLSPAQVGLGGPPDCSPRTAADLCCLETCSTKAPASS